MEIERAARAAEKAQDQAVFTAREDARKEIKAAQEELLVAVRELRQAERDHGQAIQKLEKDHRAEVKVLEEENVRLREQLISLQAKLTVPG